MDSSGFLMPAWHYFLLVIFRRIAPKPYGLEVTGGNFQIVQQYFTLAVGVGITITLPDATLFAGQTFVVKNGGGSAVAIATLGGQTVDGAPPSALASLAAGRYTSDGSNWWLT